jgi:multimeric flavodoxin WrbA
VPRLLVVHHSPTTATAALADAVTEGARDDAIDGVEVEARPALSWARDEADHTTLLDADGYVLVTPANLGTMSGALKHVFDSTFLHVGGALSDDGTGGTPGDTDVHTRGRPLGLLVHGRYDTTGAVRDVLAVTGALGWRQVAEVLEVLGDVTDDDLAAAYELGATVAAVLSMG